MRAAERPASRRRGLTLVELTISLGIFSALGWGLLVGLHVARDCNRTVQRVAGQNRSLRASSSQLVDELRNSSDATVAVTVLPDGNHQVRFQSPIEDGGAAAWGVFDPLGTDAATRNLVGWSLQYTVRPVAQPDGTVVRELVRQVLDPAQTVRREQVLAAGLRRGVDVPPGFTMAPQGDVWEITLSTVGATPNTTGISTVLHVRTRN